MRFADFLREQKEKHAVMAFGRMNPITVGHEKLVNKVQELAIKQAELDTKKKDKEKHEEFHRFFE